MTQTPIDFISYLTLLSTSLGVYLALYLLIIKSNKNNANLLLAAFVLIFTLFPLPAFLEDIGLLDDLPHVHGLAAIFTFASGPLLYLYVRTCTQKGFELRPILYLHFIPFLVVILYDMPFLILDGEAKVEMYLNFYKTGKPRTNLLPFFRSIHAAIYVFIAIRLVFQYKKHLENTASSIDVIYHRWLLIFSSFLLMPFVAMLVMAFLSTHLLSLYLLTIAMFLFFMMVLIAALVKPGIFHAFPHQMLIPESKEEQKQKYETSNLQESQKQKILEQVQQYMTAQKPYQEGNFTIADLSEQVHIPTHYLSQVINEKMDCNFLDFINRYRIEEAKNLLGNEKYAHYTILAVAFEAGFNSKSAFYAAFKKYTGMTPGRYRKSLVLAK